MSNDQGCLKRAHAMMKVSGNLIVKMVLERYVFEHLQGSIVWYALTYWSIVQYAPVLSELSNVN